MAQVLLATCAALPMGDEDAPLLDAALAAAGIDAAWACWDDPEIDWSSADLVVVRSTWDYIDRRAEFCSWAASVPSLLNPAAVLEWNTDKRYLADLERVGIPVTPTSFLTRIDELELPDAPRVVIKPSVGAGSKGAALFGIDDLAAITAHVETLLAHGHCVMVQPYLETVDTQGETDVVVIEGHPIHAVRKGAMLHGLDWDPSGLFIAEQISPRQASPAQMGLAAGAIEAASAHLGLSEALLYGRVDLIETDAGPVILELELTEPSLFLSHSPTAAESLARAIERRLGS
jgi:glutathione synthase/RimK-type ligase-like ATP-grasp enzyme